MPKGKSIDNIRSLWRYLLPYKYKLSLGLVLLFISAYLELINPKLFREIINELNENIVNLDDIYIYLGLVVLVILFRAIFLFYSRYILISLSRRVEYDLRNKLFRHILTLPTTFFDKHKLGDIISRLTVDIDQVRMIFGPGIMYTFNVFFLLVLSLKDMYLVDASLSIYVVIPLIALSYLIWSIGKRYYHSSRLIQEELAKMSNFVNENLEGIRVIKSFVREELVKNSFNRINKNFIKKNMSLAKLSGVFRPTLYFIAGSTSIIILWLGGLKVYRGEFSLGHLVEFLRYIEILSIPLMAFGWVMSLYQRGFAAYDRLKDFFLEESQSFYRIPNSNLINNRRVKKLELQDLSFTYPDARHKSLDKINFKIMEGEKIAIIGPTGSGKTSLLSLLLRVYEPFQDSIFVNNLDITSLPIKEYRELFSYAPQNNYIFPYTVAENIRLANYISDSEIRKLAAIVELADDIETFPNAYNEYVGERGVVLSGGQKQRLSLARALASNASVFLFDDSFSAIDSSTEAKILSNISSHYPNKTIIIIAHRLSTIKGMDKIIVMEYGRLVAIASPKELANMDTYYRTLVRHELLSGEFS